MLIKSKKHTDRTVHLLLTFGHYCINESTGQAGKEGKESINSIIYKLQKEHKLRVFTQYELTLAARTHYVETNEHLEYHDLCCRMFTIESDPSGKKLYDAALCSRLKCPDVSEDCIPEFILYLRVYEHIDPRNYKSLALIGQQILFQNNCFTGVYQLTGKPRDFIKLCCHAPYIMTQHNQRIKRIGDIVQIDRNGSYPSTYASFKGIPLGKPKSFYGQIPTCDYYFVQIQIFSYKCKHCEDYFPILKSTGIQFYDKTMFELILERYYVDYKIIDGYAFDEGFNTNISEVTRRLYLDRKKFKDRGSDIQLIIKRMLNSMWGKSSANRRDTSIINIPYEQSLDKFINTNADYIVRGINREFVLMKPYIFQYSWPFLTYVLKKNNDLSFDDFTSE
jgi:hypothetical protein